MLEYLFDLRQIIVTLVAHLLQIYLLSETVIKRIMISVLATNNKIDIYGKRSNIMVMKNVSVYIEIYW